METFLYAVMHMLVDGLCAFAMFAKFKGSDGWYLYLLEYNFCAFALQLLFGSLMDYLKKLQDERRLMRFRLPFICAALGLFVTVVGACTHPVVLGIGNALFHVGGGIGTIENDRKKKLRGQALGIFVAPGALGLFLGGYFGAKISSINVTGVALLFASIFVALLTPFVLREPKPEPRELQEHEQVIRRQLAREPFMLVSLAVLLAFLVVVVRSYCGLMVGFSWKTGFAYGLACALAVVLGKMAGGILSARFGALMTSLVSLGLAAFCYLLSKIPGFGIAALFLFNMTMPITLYMIVNRLRALPGFSFGLLTFALFLGLLPSYFGHTSSVPSNLEGMLLSMLSLVLLLAALLLLGRAKETGRRSRKKKSGEQPAERRRPAPVSTAAPTSVPALHIVDEDEDEEDAYEDAYEAAAYGEVAYGNGESEDEEDE